MRWLPSCIIRFAMNRLPRNAHHALCLSVIVQHHRIPVLPFRCIVRSIFHPSETPQFCWDCLASCSPYNQFQIIPSDAHDVCFREVPFQISVPFFQPTFRFTFLAFTGYQIFFRFSFETCFRFFQISALTFSFCICFLRSLFLWFQCVCVCFFFVTSHPAFQRFRNLFWLFALLS